MDTLDYGFIINNNYVSMLQIHLGTTESLGINPVVDSCVVTQKDIKFYSPKFNSIENHTNTYAILSTLYKQQVCKNVEDGEALVQQFEATHDPKIKDFVYLELMKNQFVNYLNSLKPIKKYPNNIRKSAWDFYHWFGIFDSMALVEVSKADNQVVVKIGGDLDEYELKELIQMVCDDLKIPIEKLAYELLKYKDMYLNICLEEYKS